MTKKEQRQNKPRNDSRRLRLTLHAVVYSLMMLWAIYLNSGTAIIFMIVGHFLGQYIADIHVKAQLEYVNFLESSLEKVLIRMPEQVEKVETMIEDALKPQTLIKALVDEKLR